MTALRIAIWAASKIILLLVFGKERVTREHLQIVKCKPQLVVSNGVTLWNKGFEHFLIGQLIWFAIAIPLYLAAWRLLPQPDREATQQGTYSRWSLLAAVTLFFAVGLVPLKFILLITPLAVTAIILTARTATRQSRAAPVSEPKPCLMAK